MKRIRIFLASSSELKEEREQFEIMIYRKCKSWFDKGIFLHLDIWEDFLDKMAKGGLQNEYNKTIRHCDIFVLLAYNKVGKFTNEEFKTAFKQFSETDKPFIFTYFKKPVTTHDQEDLLSLTAFEKELWELKHYKTEYKNIDELKFHFSNQLEKLRDRNFLGLPPQDTDSKIADIHITQTAEKIYNFNNSNFKHTEFS